MIEIATVFARRFDVLCEIDTTFRKRPADATQNCHRIGLVVNGIKGCDEIKDRGRSSLVKIA
jgi:hypothetical protein